jgi:DNA invertase Pin-like site-specific DNA recombinase
MKTASRRVDPAKFVAYYRVSTRGQGQSGLGLEAQERAVKAHVASIGGGRILSSFTEVESGRKSDRPQARRAMADARKKGAILLVAKMDRLTRDLKFLVALRDSGVKFVAADFPEANEFMVGILVLVGEWEAKMISLRTKAGLESRRLRMLKLDKNFKLGNVKNLRRGCSPAPAMNRAKAQAEAERLRPVINDFRSKGIVSLRRICDALNEAGHVTGRGMAFYPATVRRLVKRLGIQ